RDADQVDREQHDDLDDRRQQPRPEVLGPRCRQQLLTWHDGLQKHGHRRHHALASAIAPAIMLPRMPNVSYDMPANSARAAVNDANTSPGRPPPIVGPPKAVTRSVSTNQPGRANPGAAFTCRYRCTRPRMLVNVPSSSLMLAIGSTTALV